MEKSYKMQQTDFLLRKLFKGGNYMRKYGNQKQSGSKPQNEFLFFRIPIEKLGNNSPLKDNEP